MHDLKISKSGQSLRLSIIDRTSLGSSDFVLNRAKDTALDEECSRILTDVRLGLQRHNIPIMTDVLDCTGGVYFLRSATGRKVAVFKPQDEEQGMPHNTKGYEGSGESGLRQHYKPGYGCMREVAAYLMDVNNYCSVPPTSLVHFEHPILNYPGREGRNGHPFPKFGSLQKFVHAFDSFEDIGISVLSYLEVQKIALLDLRLLNSDRNASNILAIHKDSYGEGSPTKLQDYSTEDSKISKYCFDEEFDLCFDDVTASKSEGSSNSDSYALILIDHGYCLPSKLLINEIDWAWFYYPQVNRAVHPEIKKHLSELDVEAILKNVLSQVDLSGDAQFLVRVSHQLVVDGVAAGLTLHEIALIVARINDDEPSVLEKVLEEAEENAHRTIEMRIGTVERSRNFYERENSKINEKLYQNPVKKINENDAENEREEREVKVVRDKKNDIERVKEKNKEKEKDRVFWKSPEKVPKIESSKSPRKRSLEKEIPANLLSPSKSSNFKSSDKLSVEFAECERTLSYPIENILNYSSDTEDVKMKNKAHRIQILRNTNHAHETRTEELPITTSTTSSSATSHFVSSTSHSSTIHTPISHTSSPSPSTSSLLAPSFTSSPSSSSSTSHTSTSYTPYTSISNTILTSIPIVINSSPCTNTSVTPVTPITSTSEKSFPLTLTAPKTIPYFNALHGQALHSIQSEDGSIRYTNKPGLKGSGISSGSTSGIGSGSISGISSGSIPGISSGSSLRRMNAINAYALGAATCPSTPLGQSLLALPQSARLRT